MMKRVAGGRGPSSMSQSTPKTLSNAQMSFLRSLNKNVSMGRIASALEIV